MPTEQFNTIKQVPTIYGEPVLITHKYIRLRNIRGEVMAEYDNGIDVEGNPEWLGEVEAREVAVWVDSLYKLEFKPWWIE